MFFFSKAPLLGFFLKRNSPVSFFFEWDVPLVRILKFA